MVWRRPNVGQTERYVRSVPMGDQLDWCQPLIVVGRNHNIKFSSMCPVIETVGRKRPGNANSGVGAFLDSGAKHVELFAAEHSVLAGMGIDPGYCNRRI